MSNDSTKARAKPHLSRPMVLIGQGEYTLNPCDVAREREFDGVRPSQVAEKAGQQPDDIRKLQPESAAPLRPDLWGPVFDELSDDELAELVHQRAARSPAFAARFGLTPAFERTAAPSIALPDKPPRLWADRPVEERGMNPAAFIRTVYAPWLDHGLTRAHIKKFDPPLYVSYAQWIRPERHPKDAISFAPSHMFNAYADPVEATAQRRMFAREARARQRARAKNDKLSQNVLPHDNQ